MPPPAAPTPQDPHRGEHRREDPNAVEHMAEINMIFRGSMSIASKTQGKKLQREISLTQRIEPGRRMRWSNVDISFGPEDHLDTELSERNLPFMVKIPIRWHKVAKMRKTFIEMCLNLVDLTPFHDTFHKIILG
jgi:hypothetical protein